MIKKRGKIEYLIIVFAVVLFLFISILSFYTINNLHGTARVVNYVGIVRGATQKLIKQELMGEHDDALISRLDSIVNELITGEGPNGLIVLPDDEYGSNMLAVRKQWQGLKEAIQDVRAGSDNMDLYELSQDYFFLADETVTSAEVYSDMQVNRSKNLLISVNAVFILSIIVVLIYFLRSLATKRKADQLGKIAYIDPLTQMPNRACFENSIDGMQSKAPQSKVAVFMFDMNNLKQTNDYLGHQRGDLLISEFGRILSGASCNGCTAYRYGGDEFTSVMQDADAQKIKQYLDIIVDRVNMYNANYVDEMEKISFASGYVVSLLSRHSINELLHEADRLMYIKKRQMKESRDIMCSLGSTN